MPEIDDAVGIAAGETGAEDDVGFAVDDGFEEARVFVGVVFEIGVLNDNGVARGGGDPGAKGGAFALVDLVVNDFGDERGDLVAQDVAGAVVRAVVDDDDLLVGDWGGADAVDDGADGLRLVVAGDDDGEFHAWARIGGYAGELQGEDYFRWGGGKLVVVPILTVARAKPSVARMQSVTEVWIKPGFRKAAANLGWLVAERGVRLVLGTVVGLIVARYLGPERLGALSYGVALVTLAGCVPALGLEAILKRELLNSPEKTAELLGSAWLLRLGAGALGCMAVVGMARAGWGLTGDEARLLETLALLLFQPALFLPELWLQTQLRAKAAAMAQLGALAVAAGARLWLIASEAPLTAFAWVLVGEMVLGAMGFAVMAQRAGLRMTWRAARGATMQRLLADAWPLLFASFAVLVYMKIDEVMLRHLAGPAAVGVYAAAARLSEAWYFLPTALASSVLPALVRAKGGDAAEYVRRQQQYYDVSAAAAYALSVPTALAAPWIVRVAYGPEFGEAGAILAVHIWSSVFVFLGVARGLWLVNEGQQGFYLAATLAGTLVNVGLNLVFIPRWGGVGAAWATVISYGLAAWLASYFHPAVRATAAMQTRALLIPLTGWRYFRRA